MGGRALATLPQPSLPCWLCLLRSPRLQPAARARCCLSWAARRTTCSSSAAGRVRLPAASQLLPTLAAASGWRAAVTAWAVRCSGPAAPSRSEAHCQANASPTPPLHARALAPVSCLFDANRSSVHSRAQLPALPPDAQPAAAERRFRYGPGAIVGDLDFFLQRPRRRVLLQGQLAAAAGQAVARGSSRGGGGGWWWGVGGAGQRGWAAAAGQPGQQAKPIIPAPCRLPTPPALHSFTATVEASGGAWRIGRAAFEALAARDPGTLAVLQAMVLRTTSLSMAHALEVLERSSAAE